MNTKQKIRIFGAVGGLAVLTVLLCALFLRPTPPTEDEVASLLHALQGNGSYSFASECYLKTHDDVRTYFTLFGEHAGADSHLSGTVLGTEIEVYLVDGVLYQRAADQSWQVHEAPDEQQALSLFAELSPAAAFDFSGLQDFSYVGVSESASGRCYEFRLTPRQEGWIAAYFTDVVYTVWIKLHGRGLAQIELTGRLQEDPDTTITLRTSLYDIGAAIAISAPYVADGAAEENGAAGEKETAAEPSSAAADPA